MPSKYHPVFPAVWDRTMRELSGPATVVRLYVLTCQARLSEGLYHLPLGHLIHDTGLKAEHVDQALDQLHAAGLVTYDPDAEVVLDRTALKYTPLRNGRTRDGEVKPDNRIPGAVRLFEQVPDSPLKGELYRLAREHAPDLAAALAARFPTLPGYPQEEAPSKPLASPSEGASREELEKSGAREELEQRREELEGSPEKSGKQGTKPGKQDPVLCAWCQVTPAKIERTGQPFAYEGKPWCGWCEPVAEGGAA